MQFAHIITIAGLAAGVIAAPVNGQKATFYNVSIRTASFLSKQSHQASVGIGACGRQLDESDMGVALSTEMNCKAFW